jgi:hypothetical protein
MEWRFSHGCVRTLVSLDFYRGLTMYTLLFCLSNMMTTTLAAEPADAPVALRMESFGVSPAHVPPAIVVIKNASQTLYQGAIRLELPEGWAFAPETQSVTLQPGEKGTARFSITKGRAREANSYPITIVADGAGKTVKHLQNVVCTSAPYFKPEIDGTVEEWKDAIPVEFSVGGKKTMISTYWNRRQFSILVAVEEDEYSPLTNTTPANPFDAIQLAISPQETITSDSPEDDATRYEFLFAGTGSGTQGKCFQLAEPGMKLSDTEQPRDLQPLEFDKAKVAVKRTGAITYYECGIPFRSLKQIRPSEGREFFLSILVHDPNGTGIRDWGKAAGLFSCEAKRLAWSVWKGAKWPEKPLYDNKTPWGLCSSKY